MMIEIITDFNWGEFIADSGLVFVILFMIGVTANWNYRQNRKSQLNQSDLKAQLYGMQLAYSGKDVAYMIRDKEGVIKDVSPLFVESYLVPLHYDKSDVIGKKIRDIKRFDKTLKTRLDIAHSRCVENGSVVIHKVQIFPDRFVTVGKNAITLNTGEVVFKSFFFNEN